MKEVTVNGKKRMCYIIKRGDVNDIVVTYDSLAHVDIKRFHKMESEGGDLMRVMRDTTLENGMNALKMYEGLLRVVPVEKEVATPVVSEKSILDVSVPPKKAVKKGRGRPKKKKT